MEIIKHGCFDELGDDFNKAIAELESELNSAVAKQMKTLLKSR